jgi:hypothetical protein
MKHTITIDIGTDVVDIPTMHSMSAAEYSTYIEDSLLWVDHHDVLRVTHGDYSVAATSEQVEKLWRMECAALAYKGNTMPRVTPRHETVAVNLWRAMIRLRLCLVGRRRTTGRPRRT